MRSNMIIREPKRVNVLMSALMDSLVGLYRSVLCILHVNTRVFHLYSHINMWTYCLLQCTVSALCMHCTAHHLYSVHITCTVAYIICTLRTSCIQCALHVYLCVHCLYTRILMCTAHIHPYTLHGTQVQTRVHTEYGITPIKTLKSKRCR